MTEQEWLTCSHPTPMMKFLRGEMVGKEVQLGSGTVIRVPDYPYSRVSDRKARLFGCGCCRRIWHRLKDEASRTAVEVAEQFVDGQATEEQLNEAGIAAEAAVNAAYEAVHAPMEAEAMAAGLEPVDWVHGAWELASDACAAERAATETTEVRTANVEGWESAARAAGTIEDDLEARDPEAEAVERRTQAELLRCIAGNPFRPVTPDPAWLTSDVLLLAQGIYEDRAFDRMPILADALQDAGCDNEAVLNHCRGAGPHVRGCWVVDLLLGKA